MKEIKKFKKLLKKIDDLLNNYTSGHIHNDKIGNEVSHSKHRSMLEKAIDLINAGLDMYPYNPELLRRRSFAKSRVVTEEGECVLSDEAEQDLRTILEFSPYDLDAAFVLLHDSFTNSRMDDEVVAQDAMKLADQAENLLLSFIVLQIRALGFADKHSEADRIYNKWSKKFPEAKRLRFARDDADSV